MLVVCEGIPDALTAAPAGLTAVGILGSQAPDHSVASRIAGYAAQHGLDVIAVADNDPAGRASGVRLQHLLADHAVEPTIVVPPGEGATSQLGVDRSKLEPAVANRYDAAIDPPATPSFGVG